MIDTLHPPRIVGQPVAVGVDSRAPRVRMALELRALAEDLAGTLDRDAVTIDEEALLADAVEEAVATVLPRIVAALDEELTPRIGALPLHTRLALAEARRRRLLGYD